MPGVGVGVEQWISDLLLSLLWPLQPPLFSRAPSETRSSPSREGDDLGSSAVPCQSVEKSTPTLGSPFFGGGGDQDRSLEGFEGIYREPKPRGYRWREEGWRVLYESLPKEKRVMFPHFLFCLSKTAMFTVLGLQQVTTV